MRISGLFASLAALAALLAGSGQAEAFLMGYEVSGTVTETTAGVSEVGVGDPFTISMTLETTASDVVPSPTVGRYPFAITALTFSLGGFSGGFSGAVVGTLPGDVSVWNGTDGFDGFQFLVFPDYGGTPDGLPIGVIEVDLYDTDNALLSDDSLLEALLLDTDLLQFSRDVVFYLGFGSEGGYSDYVFATVDAAGPIVVLQPIPEPAALALLTVGLAGVGFACGRRRLWKGHRT